MRCVAAGVHVSLPRNELGLAEAALELGAVGLKVHIEVDHRASGHSFGTLEQEAPVIERILSLGAPVGLVVGSGERVSSRTIRAAAKLPFAYFDLYVREMPGDYVAASMPVQPMVAVGPEDTPELASRLEQDGIAAFELSTLAPDRYGRALTPATIDLISRYRATVSSPLIVPSQHRLVPSDLASIAAAGASAVLLGAVVLGVDEGSLRAALPAFVAAGEVFNEEVTKEEQ